MKTEKTAMVVCTDDDLQVLFIKALQPLVQKIEKLERLLDGGESEYISTKEAAKLLGVQERTVRRHQNEGKIKSYKVDGFRSHQFKRVEVLQLARRL